jgi:hypothetical protein
MALYILTRSSLLPVLAILLSLHSSSLQAAFWLNFQNRCA